MKKVMIIPDKFKGSYSSIDIADIVENAILKTNPSIQTIKIPISDGGEGFIDCLSSILKGKRISLYTHDPMMHLIETSYFITEERVAIIELASSSGLHLIDHPQNPHLTTTFGVGEQIIHALKNGCRRFIIGLGGSATNDGGSGILAALGVTFYNQNDERFIPHGGSLQLISKIDVATMIPEARQAKYTVFTDVNNPLTGFKGASFVYARQKGATKTLILFLEENMLYYEKMLQEDLHYQTDFPGAGAAGGASVAFKCFLGATIEPGIQSILKMLHFDELIQNVSLIITGEGKLDRQSFQGKVVDGIAEYADKYHVPFVSISGQIEGVKAKDYPKGLLKAYSLRKPDESTENAIANTKSHLEEVTLEVLHEFLP